MATDSLRSFDSRTWPRSCNQTFGSVAEAGAPERRERAVSWLLFAEEIVPAEQIASGHRFDCQFSLTNVRSPMSRQNVVPYPKSAASVLLERQLVRLSGGDTLALGVIYDLTYPKLLKVAVGVLSDAHESEDVVHDAYMRIWQRAGLYQSTCNGGPMPWLVRIVRNAAIDRLRRRRHVEHIDDHEGSSALLDPTPSAHTRLETKEQALLVAKMMEGLSLRAAAALHIAFFDDETHAVVAQRLGIPEGTAKSTIRRTLERLKPEAETIRSGEPVVFLKQA